MALDNTKEKEMRTPKLAEMEQQKPWYMQLMEIFNSLFLPQGSQAEAAVETIPLAASRAARPAAAQDIEQDIRTERTAPLPDIKSVRNIKTPQDEPSTPKEKTLKTVPLPPEKLEIDLTPVMSQPQPAAKLTPLPQERNTELGDYEKDLRPAIAASQTAKGPAPKIGAPLLASELSNPHHKAFMDATRASVDASRIIHDYQAKQELLQEANKVSSEQNAAKLHVIYNIKDPDREAHLQASKSQPVPKIEDIKQWKAEEWDTALKLAKTAADDTRQADNTATDANKQAAAEARKNADEAYHLLQVEHARSGFKTPEDRNKEIARLQKEIDQQTVIRDASNHKSEEVERQYKIDFEKTAAQSPAGIPVAGGDKETTQAVARYISHATPADYAKLSSGDKAYLEAKAEELKATPEYKELEKAIKTKDQAQLRADERKAREAYSDYEQPRGDLEKAADAYRTADPAKRSTVQSAGNALTQEKAGGPAGAAKDAAGASLSAAGKHYVEAAQKAARAYGLKDDMGKPLSIATPEDAAKALDGVNKSPAIKKEMDRLRDAWIGYPDGASNTFRDHQKKHGELVQERDMTLPEDIQPALAAAAGKEKAARAVFDAKAMSVAKEVQPQSHQKHNIVEEKNAEKPLSPISADVADAARKAVDGGRFPFQDAGVNGSLRKVQAPTVANADSKQQGGPSPT